ncbi:MAG: hypothetical protein DMF41_11105 [Verrucomicrobia bacterium]|nr:MAG: hypothetical protein DMF41_11105 [Verrucomicrobiota bacterium]
MLDSSAWPLLLDFLLCLRIKSPTQNNYVPLIVQQFSGRSCYWFSLFHRRVRRRPALLGQDASVSQLSTGREGLNTPYGHFSVTQKDVNHVSSLFGDYVDSAGNVVVPNVDITKDPKPPGTHFRGTPMPYFMRIVSGTGLHAGYLPGYPASHGCIRMPEFMAENFFKSVSVGTPVTITN